MAKPDMSRNKDLAGKTVSKGGYKSTKHTQHTTYHSKAN